MTQTAGKGRPANLPMGLAAWMGLAVCLICLAVLHAGGPARADSRVLVTELPEPVTGTATVPTGEATTYTYYPATEAPYPAVFFLQGYPCRTAAPGDNRNLARNRLLARYVEAGFLVHTVEKPGLGDGSSSTACRDLLYEEEVDAFRHSLDDLAQRPDIDPDNIFLFGHSLGGQTAPLIAQDRNVRGIITYGIHAKPWFEYMIDISRRQSERLGMDPVVADRETRQMIPYLYDLMVLKKDWDYLSTTHAEAIAIGILAGDGLYLNGRHYTFWASLNDPDYAGAWAGFGGRVLAIYGEYDIASISPEGAERIARIVNYHHPGNARALLLDRSGHGFAVIDGTFEEYMALRFSDDWSGAKEAAYFNDRLADETITWMQDVMAE